MVPNLKDEADRNVLFQLARVSDVVVENFRPGVMDKLGVGYDILREVNPRIVYCFISGFGLSGKYSHLPALDLVCQAMSGPMLLNGRRGDPPIKVPLTAADLTSSLYAVIGILAALKHRDATGQGQRVEISMMDALMSLIMDESMDFWASQDVSPRMGNALLRLTPFNSYKTSDGYFVIASSGDEHWQRILETIGREDLKDDPRYRKQVDRTANAAAVDRIIEAWSETVTTADAVAAIMRAGIPCGPVRDFMDAYRDPVLQQRGIVMPLPHPTVGPMEGYYASGVPIKFSDAEVGYEHQAPFLGQHTEEVLSGLGIEGKRTE